MNSLLAYYLNQNQINTEQKFAMCREELGGAGIWPWENNAKRTLKLFVHLRGLIEDL